jgi:hypothetical protein
MNISVILIYHKYGEDIRVATNKKSEIRHLAKYVHENWDKEKNGDMPKDQEEMIKAYFDSSDEYYEVNDFDVRPKRKKSVKTMGSKVYGFSCFKDK